MPIYMEITDGTAKGKKLKASFYKKENGKRKYLKVVQFGSKGSQTYLDHSDKAIRKRYIARHRKNENWNNYMSAGALSRYLLWGDSSSLLTNIKKYKSRFKLA
tara:strand:+ start:1614 stop:1922 length:309 start_codon:yes stop_codon:yes gene_type:complete